MAEKFPIIKFTQRDFDNGRTPGGGGGKKPRWVLTGKELINHGKQLVDEIDSLNSDWKFNVENHIPKTIEVTFIEDAKAKTHQTKIVDLFSVNDKLTQIGMASEYSLIIKVMSPEDMTVVKNRLLEIQKNDIQISAIEEIGSYSPNVELQNSQVHYKIDLLDYRDQDTNASVKQYLIQVFEDREIDYSFTMYGESEIVEINESNLDKLRFIKDIPIKSIEPMEETMPPFPFLKFDYFDEANFVKYNPEREYPVIGLLDSGVEMNSFTESWVIRGNGSDYWEDDLNTNHGTYIASLLIHGDKLNGYSDSEYPGCTIVDVPVVPNHSISGPTLIQNIDKGISSNPEVKIWNLSISLNGEIQNDKFSDFAIELDKIQAKYNVLIFKSAGNDSSFYSGGVAGKLSLGADSVRSITVGSMNRNSDDYGYTIANYPAPYSRIGKGPGYIVKPELSYFGGDVFALKKNPTTKNEFDTIGERGFSSQDMEEFQVGTSFSTPKVAKLAAEVAMSIDTDFDPLLMKALLIHSANYCETPALKWADKLNKLGYGKPGFASTLLSEDNHSVTLLLQGNLQKGRNIDIMDFPYPKNLVKDGKFNGRIKITLVYNPYLEGHLGNEYCQSNIELKFGTFLQKFDREGPYKRFNPIERRGSKNLLNLDLYAKNKMKKNASYSVERLQIKFGDKYYPVKKYDCDLKELRDSNEQFVESNRNWYLFLEGKYRDFITKGFQENRVTPSMDYCLIVTIIDTDKQENVYDSALKSLELNNFDYNEITTDINLEINQDFSE